MRSINFSGFLLRSPFYPYSTTIYDNEFLEHLNSPMFKEALLLSAPDLYEEFQKNFPKLDNKLKLTLYKYFLRMSYRCTPFGLFSGVSVCKSGNETNLKLLSCWSYKKNTRPDNHLLSTYAEQALQSQDLRFNLNWYVNNTVYAKNDTVRYVEYKLNNNTRSYHLSSALNTAYLNQILNRAISGATIHELAAVIKSNEVSIDEAVEFIEELIKEKLLLSELEMRVTGHEPYLLLLEKLSKVENYKEYPYRLEALIGHLRDIDKAGPGAPNLYSKVFDWVSKSIPSYDKRLAIQSDLYKPLSASSISFNVIRDIEKAIQFIGRISEENTNPRLQEFVHTFSKRYEESEMPLLDVLDTESGIGYPVGDYSRGDLSPLLHGLELEKKDDTKLFYRVTEWHRRLLSLYHKCLVKGGLEIQISDDDAPLASTQSNQNDIQTSLYAICSLLGSRKDFRDNNYLIDLKGGGGPSSVNLLSRFCFTDNELNSLVMNLIEEEERLYPNLIFAEIVHLPQARVGNILLRPVLRKYEIPILTPSSVSPENTITLDDLLVSVQDSKIILRSKRLNKQIIPRNSTAHNYSLEAVPYYLFLSDLQAQESKQSLSWSWGMLKEFKFLPRVIYGRVILAKARWVIDEIELKLPKLDKEKFRLQLKFFLKENCVPRWVTLSQGDNQLPIDIESEMCIEILFQEFSRTKSIIIEENLFTDENLLVEGPEGKYTNELIVPLIYDNDHRIRFLNERRAKLIPKIQRTFPPGSSWLYIKVYSGFKVADNILKEVVTPFVSAMLDTKTIDKFFFIRYFDTDHHLRIRFKVSKDTSDLLAKFNELIDPFINTRLVWKVQIDTYSRELERYGAENIENTETLFFHDSVATIEILQWLEGDEGDDVRWQFAIKGINDLLEDFGYSLEKKEKLMKQMRDGMAREFNAYDTHSQRKLSDHYRRWKKDVESILDSADHKEYSVIWNSFDKRSKNSKACISRIKSYADSLESPGLDGLTSSYIHMFVNRFMRSKQRLHEFVMYDFLCQYYRSKLARQRQSLSIKESSL